MISLCGKLPPSQATGAEGTWYHLKDTVTAQLQLLDSLWSQFSSEALLRQPCRNPQPILLLLVQEPWDTKFLPAVTGANGHKAGQPGLLKHLLLLLQNPSRTTAAQEEPGSTASPFATAAEDPAESSALLFSPKRFRVLTSLSQPLSRHLSVPLPRCQSLREASLGKKKNSGREFSGIQPSVIQKDTQKIRKRAESRYTNDPLPPFKSLLIFNILSLRTVFGSLQILYIIFCSCSSF